MEGEALAAIVVASVSLVGTGVTLWANRGSRRASTELTEEQAEEIRSKVWLSLNDSLRAEIIRLQARITEMEGRLAKLDDALREKTAELAAVQAERDQLRIELAAARTELTAREREIGDLKAQLAQVRPTMLGG